MMVLVGMSLCVFMCVHPRASEYTNLDIYVCENVWVGRRGRREEEGEEEEGRKEEERKELVRVIRDQRGQRK